MGVFDLGHQHKCPKCSKSMDYIYGNLLCSECGYMVEYQADIKAGIENVGKEQLERKGKSQIEREQLTDKEVVRKQVQSKYADRYEEDAYQMEETVVKNTRNTSKKMIHNRLAGVMLAIVFSILFINYLFGDVSTGNVFSTVFDDDIYMTSIMSDIELPAEIEQILLDEGWNMPVSQSEEQSTELMTQIAVEIPGREEQAPGIVEFVEKVFDMPYEKVTQKEYERITYLDFYIYDTVSVSYQIMPENGDGFGEYLDVKLESNDFTDSDFSVFTKLNTLFINNATFVNMQNMQELVVLGTNCTPSEIAECLDPKQFISMTFFDLSEEDSLEGISAFKNLTSLYLYAYGVTDISELESLENMDSLGIFYADYVTDFSVLQKMKSVEYLNINSKNLDSFEFVTHMPNLISLNIEECVCANAKQWDYVARSQSIQSLYINSCRVPYSVEKFWSMPKLSYFSIIGSEAGINMDEIPYNESMEQMYIAYTDFVEMSSNVYNPYGDKVNIKSYKKELQKAYPNMGNFECE